MQNATYEWRQALQFVEDVASANLNAKFTSQDRDELLLAVADPARAQSVSTLSNKMWNVAMEHIEAVLKDPRWVPLKERNHEVRNMKVRTVVKYLTARNKYLREEKKAAAVAAAAAAAVVVAAAPVAVAAPGAAAAIM